MNPYSNTLQHYSAFLLGVDTQLPVRLRGMEKSHKLELICYNYVFPSEERFAVESSPVLPSSFTLCCGLSFEDGSLTS